MAQPVRDDGHVAPAAPPAVPAAAPDRGDPHKYLIAFAVVLAALMQVIDSSIVNVALPDNFDKCWPTMSLPVIRQR